MAPLNKQTHTDDEVQLLNSVGFRIQYLRKKKWLSTAELAEKAGLSVNTIWNLESTTPFGVSLVTLYRISKALDVDIGELFNLN